MDVIYIRNEIIISTRSSSLIYPFKKYVAQCALLVPINSMREAGLQHISFMRSKSCCAKRHFNKSVFLVLKTRYVKDDRQDMCTDFLKSVLHEKLLQQMFIIRSAKLMREWFRPLSPSIKLQILLLCFRTFLTEVVGEFNLSDHVLNSHDLTN